MAYSDPLGFSFIWTTYGTWLPGDQRGWTLSGEGSRQANPLLERWCRAVMVEPPIILDGYERGLVNRTVVEVCHHRQWFLHIVNARTNHVHVVVSAPSDSSNKVRESIKAWCTRRLKERQQVMLTHFRCDQIGFDCVRENWWTEGGYAKPLYSEAELEAAIVYVGESQDRGGSKGNLAMPGGDYLRETAPAGLSDNWHVGGDQSHVPLAHATC